MQVQSLIEQLFFTTVRIDTVGSDGAKCAGTGFMFSHSVGEVAYPFVVTNRHVVDDMQTGTIHLLRGANNKPLLGQAFKLELANWPTTWFRHPDPDIDIAICPFAPLEAQIRVKHGVELFFRFVQSSMIPTAQQLDDLDALESVTFMGYPDGMWDSKNFLPIARRGVTATPLSVEYEHGPRFLIDASVFGGSSGSPVFIVDQGAYSTKKGAMLGGTRLHFVGVVAAAYFRTELNTIISAPVPITTSQTVEQREMIDLGIVEKARTVVEAVEAYLEASGHKT